MSTDTLFIFYTLFLEQCFAEITNKLVIKVRLFSLEKSLPVHSRLETAS